MWMKAEPTKCPHSGPAGLTAPLFSCLLSARENAIPHWQGPDPDKGSRGDLPPPETGQSHSPPSLNPVARTRALVGPGWMLVL